MDSKPSFKQKYPALKDIFSFLLFIGAVALGTFILNSFVFRSYDVVCGSMENTLQSHDRVIVNRNIGTLPRKGVCSRAWTNCRVREWR